MSLAVSALPASAAVQYVLNCDNTSSCSGNYGTVTLTQLGTGAVGDRYHVQISVSLASGYEFGDSGTRALLWNGTTSDTLSVTGITSNASAFAVQGGGANGSYAPPSPFNGTGDFDYAINRTNNGGDPNTLTFDVSKTGANIMVAQFQTVNDGSPGAYYFGATIQLISSGADFFVASSKTVPEPATWLLFFAALAGLTVLYRRRKLARA